MAIPFKICAKIRTDTEKIKYKNKTILWPESLLNMIVSLLFTNKNESLFLIHPYVYFIFLRSPLTGHAMKKHNHMLMPGEKLLETASDLCKKGTDSLVQNLLETKHSGYARFESANKLGLAFFVDGEFQEGYLLEEDTIIAAGVHALFAFRELCKEDALTWIIETDPQKLRLSKEFQLGEVVVPVSLTRIFSFNSIYDYYKERIDNGYLLINTPDDGRGLIHIVNGKWLLKLEKQKFTGMLEQEGAVACLIKFDPEAFKEKIASARSQTEVKAKPEVDIKAKIRSFLKDNYKDVSGNLIVKLENEKIDEKNYKVFLKECEAFLEFFVDSKHIRNKLLDLIGEIEASF
jgi:hypothetical protein